MSSLAEKFQCAVTDNRLVRITLTVCLGGTGRGKVESLLQNLRQNYKILIVEPSSSIMDIGSKDSKFKNLIRCISKEFVLHYVKKVIQKQRSKFELTPKYWHKDCLAQYAAQKIHRFKKCEMHKYNLQDCGVAKIAGNYGTDEALSFRRNFAIAVSECFKSIGIFKRKPKASTHWMQVEQSPLIQSFMRMWMRQHIYSRICTLKT